MRYRRSRSMLIVLLLSAVTFLASSAAAVARPVFDPLSSFTGSDAEWLPQGRTPTGDTVSTWRILLLIFRETDTGYVDEAGVAHHVTAQLPQSDIDELVAAFNGSLPAAVEQWSEGQAGWQVEVQYPDQAITQVDKLGADNYWVSPSCISAAINQYYRAGYHDTIMVYWRSSDDAGKAIPSYGWGWSSDSLDPAYGYVTVTYLGWSPWNPSVAEGGTQVWIHEWLHSTSWHYQRMGYRLPKGDADGAESHGYVENQGPYPGWGTYYADLMNNRVLEGGVYTGIPAEAWKQGTIKDRDGSSRVFNGHRYKVITGFTGSWQQAQAECAAAGGHLATITSKEENTFVSNYAISAGAPNAYFGATDAAVEGVWRWITGEPWSYSNWGAGEPSNSGGSEHYGMFWFSNGSWDGTWNDGSFAEAEDKAYVCEWDGTSDGDTTAPTTSASGADSNWHRTAVTITFSATDNAGGSGVATTEYLVDAGAWTTGTSATINAPADHTGDGTHTVAYRSRDVAGNTEAEKSVTVKIDTTNPGGSFRLNDGAAQTSSRSVSGDSAVTDASPLQMRFSTDNQASWSAWASYAATASLTLPAGAGVKTVHAQYRDAAGNLFETSDTIELIDGGGPADTTPPVLSVSGASSGGHYRSDRTLVLAATDSGSGVAAITYVLDGVEHTGAGASAVLTVAAWPNARHSFRAWATDAAGNRSSTTSFAFVTDTEGPAIAVKAASGRKGKPISLRYYLSDALATSARNVRLVIRNASGQTAKSYALGSVALNTWYSVSWTPRVKGTYRYSVSGKDTAGNPQGRVATGKVVVK